MGLLKGIFKVGASAVLVGTGVASSILKGMSDVVGVELGSELFGAARDASINGIRNMWDTEEAEDAINKAETATYGLEDSSRRQMADQARRRAQIARKAANETTDPAKKEAYMKKYEEAMEQYNNYR